jgi:hypothetical protein
MVTYLVHLPVESRPGSADGLDRMVLVKDRFHWLAFVLPLLWALYHRLWLAFLVLLAAGVALGAAGSLLGLPEVVTIALETLLALATGVFAAELMSRKLERRGLPLVSVVTGRNEDEATRRFTDRWLAGSADASPRQGSSAVPRGPFGGPAVMGLFPEAGRT